MHISTLVGTSAAIAGGLAAVHSIGRAADKEQSDRFAADLDGDFAALLARAGVATPPGTALFSAPAAPGSLPPEVVSAECRITTEGGTYRRTAALTVSDDGKTRQLTAVREYDDLYLPSDVSAEFIRSGTAEMTWRIYDGKDRK